MSTKKGVFLGTLCQCFSISSLSHIPRLKCNGARAEPRFRPSAKGTSPFKSAGASVQSTAGSRGVRISGSNAGYTMFRGGVKSTGSRDVRISGSNAGYTMFRGGVKSTGSRGVRISGSNAGYTMFRGGVKSTGYPFHSPAFSLHFPQPPTPASPCAVAFQLDSNTITNWTITGATRHWKY
jgi:hypothetical protein